MKFYRPGDQGHERCGFPSLCVSPSQRFSRPENRHHADYNNLHGAYWASISCPALLGSAMFVDCASELAFLNALLKQIQSSASGKSLIYQLAALAAPGAALVVSPLVALMKDQVDSLTRRDIPATFVNSSLDAAEQHRRLRALAAGQYKIVLVAPERFRSRAFREALGRVPLSLLALDEAHCLSQWGHDFRPDYLRLADARREFNPPVTLALTATATPRVQEDIIRPLDLPGPKLFLRRVEEARGDED